MIYSTLLLGDKSWDLTIDAFGNIAADTTRYAIAQDVSSAIRTVLGELFYDTTIGIPYYEQVFGKNFISQLVKAYMEQAALTVPGVVSALATVALNDSRELTGNVVVVDEDGIETSIAL